MFRKITDGFCLGLGFSLASVIVVSMVWSMYSHAERTQSGETSQVINDSAPSVKAELSRSELQQKECSLLILLYGETQDVNMAAPIKRHCR